MDQIKIAPTNLPRGGVVVIQDGQIKIEINHFSFEDSSNNDIQ